MIKDSKMKKYLALLLVLLLFILSSCRNPIIMKREARSQPNTEWLSDNGKISFSVDDAHQIYGYIEIDDGEKVKFYFATDMAGNIRIYNADESDDGVISHASLEYWKCSYPSSKKFTATVEETTFFEVGQKIVFHRLD